MTPEEIRRKSDLITIGGIANEIFNTKDCYTDEKMASTILRAMYRKIPDDGKIHDTMKNLLLGDLRLLLLKILKTLQPFRYSDPIEVWGYDRTAVCTVRVYDHLTKHVIGAMHGAWIARTFELCPGRFAVIERLESRKKGAGKAVLECVMRSLKGIPIYVHVDYAHKGDEELENHSAIDESVKYYEDLGFRNITDQYGYTHTAVMMHENG